ncbi:MAG TPA: tetratricopeptide repeat protein [Rhodanobacteraceae bacterium]|nr:tetratricopeptide repeat protein [Rhodanobacteraceae bacterium]
MHPSFFAELKRRNVLRAGVLYAGAAWALSQGIAQLGPLFDAPNWAMRAFVIACVIGFPFWVAFAWFYEFTPQGIKRESEIASNTSITHSTARKLDFAIIGVMAIAIALLASGYFVRRTAPATAAASPAKPFNPPAGTLVVLPFTNLDSDAKQQYFSDGITEELTNALGQNTGLRVIAWDTASKYRDARQSAADIGKALDVANVLTGKILRQGDSVRVIVELVSAASGYQVWSDHYDDSAANVFQVQDKISAAIADALKVKLAALRPAPTVNPQAHDLVLQAHALIETARTAAPIEQARALLEQAIALDPGYADAHAKLAGAWLDLTQYSTLTLKDALPKARAEANQALALDPRNVTALLVLGNDDGAEHKIAQARAKFERALALDPSDADAHISYGNALPTKQALAQNLEAVQLDPRNATAQNNLAGNYLDLGDYVQALPPALALMKLTPHSADSALGLALIYSLLHRPEDAVKAFDLAQPDTPLAKALVAAGRLTYQSVLDPKLHAQALAAVDALRKRFDLDPLSMGDVTQLDLALGRNDTVLELLPKICAAMPVGCTTLSVYPGWLPLRGKPAFQALVKKYDTVSQPPASAASTSSSP